MSVIQIFGAASLQRFTLGILDAGLRACNENTLVRRIIGYEFASGDSCLIQLHGAPAAEAEDRLIIEALPSLFAKSDLPIVILIHRPDEIQSRHPSLKKILAEANRPFGLCFLGDLHIDDEFFDSMWALRRVVPHGFYSVQPPSLGPPYFIGTKTRFGEMRTISDAVALIGAALKHAPVGSLVGYLGGEPRVECSVATVSRLVIASGLSIGVEEWLGDESISKLSSLKIPKIFVGTGKLPPPIHFCVQLYHLNGAIRTGENSGSLHSAPSIPVIVEMNGAEKTEDLAVVKVQCGGTARVEDCEFDRAGAGIADLIHTGEVEKLLEHNTKRAAAMTPAAVGSIYAELIQELISYG